METTNRELPFSPEVFEIDPQGALIDLLSPPWDPEESRVRGY